jgi:hypothetical protein
MVFKSRNLSKVMSRSGWEKQKNKTRLIREERILKWELLFYFNEFQMSDL